MHGEYCLLQATSAMYHKILDECLTRYRPSVVKLTFYYLVVCITFERNWLFLCRIHDLKQKGLDTHRVGIMVASHNEGTVRYAVQR